MPTQSFKPKDDNACVNGKLGAAIVLVGALLSSTFGSQNPKATDTPPVRAKGFKRRDQNSNQPDHVLITIPDATSWAASQKKDMDAMLKKSAAGICTFVEEVATANVGLAATQKEYKAFCKSAGKLLPIKTNIPLEDGGKLWVCAWTEEGDDPEEWRFYKYDPSNEEMPIEHITHIPHASFTMQYAAITTNGGNLTLAPNKKSLVYTPKFALNSALVTTVRKTELQNAAGFNKFAQYLAPTAAASEEEEEENEVDIEEEEEDAVTEDEDSESVRA